MNLTNFASEIDVSIDDFVIRYTWYFMCLAKDVFIMMYWDQKEMHQYWLLLAIDRCVWMAVTSYFGIF